MAKIPINLSGKISASPENIFGIDLGTTNSLIAWVDPSSGKPVVIPDPSGNQSIPSIVFVDDSGSLHVGNDAKKYQLAGEKNVFHSFKRLMGITADDHSETDLFVNYTIVFPSSGATARVVVGNRLISAIDLSAAVLRKLIQNAESYLNVPVKKVVITVPAYFNDAQRKATREAAAMANLDVIRMINEPTAASLAYGIGFTDSSKKQVAVFDLGGGTFDISVLYIFNGVFEVLSTHGNTALGGDDFDRAIIKFWIKKYDLNDFFVTHNYGQLRLIAECAKIELSLTDHFSQLFAGIQLQLNRHEFEEQISDLIDITLQACGKALSDAELSTHDIDEVILVGGATRTPYVIQRVSDYFNKPVQHSLDPDTVVAIGAAIQGDVLSGNSSDTLLLDVTPLSLGIETAGGIMDVLIPRNSKIPINASRQYTTQKDGQTSIRISIFQGERHIVSGNRLIGNFNLTGIPAMPAGLPRVQVTFSIDADGIIQITAKESRSGVAQTVYIDKGIKLTENEILSALEQSVQNERNDKQIRSFIEVKMSAESLIEQARSVRANGKDCLDADELALFESNIEMLQSHVSSGSILDIQSGIKTFNEVLEPLAKKVMDCVMKQSLSGKRLN